MDALINYLLRDAKILSKTIDRNRLEMNEGGFSDESYAALTAAIEDLSIKETAQETAAKEAENQTALQNETLSQIQKIVSDVKSAAKSAYGKDPRNLNMFNIGANVPQTLKRLVAECEYLNKLVQERKAVLLKNGLKQAKIDILSGAGETLNASDDAQEGAKKIKKMRTSERDEAAKALKEETFKIRNFAKACFSEKPLILEQFKPLPRGRGGSGNDEDETPPENPTPPAGS